MYKRYQEMDMKRIGNKEGKDHVFYMDMAVM